MGKFCGECGSAIKNGKCPKCDVKEEKKTTKKVVKEEVKEEDNGSIGWGVLGFFFPLVGLILFLVWMNNKKKSSKAAGIGALIGFVVGIFLSITSFAFFVRLVESWDDPKDYPPVIDYDWDDDDDDTDEDDDDTDEFDLEVTIKDINKSKGFQKHEFKSDSLKQIESDKEYDASEQGFKLILKNGQLSLIDDATGEVYDTVNNVSKAYYHKSDCSGWDSIIAYSGNDVYYANPRNFSYLNVKFKKLENKYKSFSIVHNLSWTCGGSILTLGSQDTAKGDEVYYDLNTETIFAADTYNYYENYDRYIRTSRSFKYDNISGEAKLVVKSSVADGIEAIIDSVDNAYAISDSGTPLIGKVTRVTVKDDVTTLYLEDGTTHKIGYSEIEY